MLCDRGVWGRMHTCIRMDESLRCSPEIITTFLISYECYASVFTLPLERKKVKLLNHVRLFATPWPEGHQAPPSMEFSMQEYRSGLPFQYKIKKTFLKSIHVFFGSFLFIVEYFSQSLNFFELKS